MSQQISRPFTDSAGKSKQTFLAHWMRTNTNTSTDRRYHSARPEQGLNTLSRDNVVDYGKAPLIDTLKTSSKNSGKEGNELSLSGFHFPGKGPSDNPPYFEKHMPNKGKEVAVNSDTSVDTSFDDFNTSLLVGRNWFPKMHGIRLLPSPSHTLDSKEDGLNNNKKKNNNINSKSRFDLEAMRICTTVDSVQVAPGGCPRFSQTTHSVLITKKSDNDVLSATRLVKKTNENMFFAHGKNREVKLRSVSSTPNGEERHNFGNFKGRKVLTIRNESSAETNTMEMGMNSGANSTPSTKAFNDNSNPTPSIAATSSRETECQWTKTGLPDINLKLPALPDVESPPQNLCLSSSRTQSLEMDMLLANADHTKTTKHITNSDDLDPSNRWVKRLKPSPPNSSPQGTKTSNPDERISHDKTKNYIKSILDYNITSPEPSHSKHHYLGQETILTVKNNESLLSNAWIKRWLRNGSGITEEKKPDNAVGKVGDLWNSKESVDVNDDLERKQFPSIGAMAMMGKAMAGFQTCEVQKRGSITVWNTKGTF